MWSILRLKTENCDLAQPHPPPIVRRVRHYKPTANNKFFTSTATQNQVFLKTCQSLRPIHPIESILQLRNRLPCPPRAPNQTRSLTHTTQWRLCNRKCLILLPLTRREFRYVRSFCVSSREVNKQLMFDDSTLGIAPSSRANSQTLL